MNAVETRIVTADEGDVRLDRWFSRHFPHVTHGRLEKLLRTGQVRVDGKRAKASTRLAEGQSVRVPPLGPEIDPADRPKPEPKPMSKSAAADLQARVLYRDPDVIVLNKPAGLAVQGGTGMVDHLDAMLDALMFDAEERPKLVHRLDKDTSGVLVLARNVFAANRLTAAFRSRETRKIYWAVTKGIPSPLQGRIDLALTKVGEKVVPGSGADAKHAVTLYSVVETMAKMAAFVALWPRTGRTHQLRAHMAAIGNPILGDGKYGGADAAVPGAEVEKALHLHARRIAIPHPRTGRLIDVIAPLPQHLLETWNYFGFDPNDRSDPFLDYE
jgi:23S rRNA pseudouridine955/2504/2580 synthase